jgi:hypothetical protein
LRGIDHCDADTVLDAVTWIEELQLGQDLGLSTVGDLPDADEGSVADQFGEVIGDTPESTL